MEELIKYWNKRASYIAEDIETLSSIYEKRHEDFNQNERETHQNMVNRYLKQLGIIIKTIQALEGLQNENK